MTYEEAFHILGLEWSDKLTEEDIKRAYRNKVKQDHPIKVEMRQNFKRIRKHMNSLKVME